MSLPPRYAGPRFSATRGTPAYLASCLRAPATDRPAMDLAVTRSDLSMDHGPDKKCRASGDLFRARAVDFRTAGPVPASPRSNRSGGLFEEFLSHRRWIKSEEKEFFSRRRRWIKSGALLSLRILYINRSMQAPKTPIPLDDRATNPHTPIHRLPFNFYLYTVDVEYVSWFGYKRSSKHTYPIHTTTGTLFLF